MKLTANEWLVIAKGKGYKAMQDGSVVGLKGQKLKLAPQSRGYLVFSVNHNGKIRAIPVHRFVAYWKYGDALFEAECVRHLDGNPHNNKFENIAIGSIRDNYFDMSEVERREIYEGRGRFGEDDIDKMIKMRGEGFLLKEIGEEFGISYSMAGMILRGDCYKEYHKGGDA